MGKEYKCRDAGVDCDAVLNAETEEELWSKMAEHGKAVHNMNIAELDKETEQKIRSLIYDV